MAETKRTVLITGCSDGGLGAALAIAFHKAGLHVYATARNPSKMSQLVDLGIETLTLDVLSESSIAAAASKLSHLDILVNNAGGTYNRPISDLSISEAKKSFDLNVWSYIAVTQAFLPLILKSKGMIVNHTSSASVITLPFQSAYNASKAATAVFSDTLRLELGPFDVKVVDVKTSTLATNFTKNNEGGTPTLPKGSIYEPAKETVETVMSGKVYFEGAGPPEPWAEKVVQALLKKKPSPIIWTGANVWVVRVGTMLPFGSLDGLIKSMSKLNVVERIIRRSHTS